MAAVDKAFLNTSAEVRAETERAFQLSFISMWGNIKLLINAICSVVVFTLILVSASTMSMAIRERFRELAVLKALGFRRRELFGFILAESFGLAAIGALLGVGGSWALFTFVPAPTLTNGFFPTLEVTPSNRGNWMSGRCHARRRGQPCSRAFRRAHERGGRFEDFGLNTMALPIKYNVRNVFVRWRSTISTILGVGLVVAVYMLVQALAVGLEASSTNSGTEGNLLVMRKGSPAESSSQVTIAHVKTIQFLEGVARDSAGKPLISPDVLVLINIPRRENRGEANVLIRGIGPNGRELRPQVNLTEGRWFTPGHREVVISKRLAARFANTGIGDKFKTGRHELTVVGHFDAGNTAYYSEICMYVDDARSIFTREYYSSLLLRTTDPVSSTNLVNRIEKDKTLSLKVLPETAFYQTQTKTAGPIRFLGDFLATAMSIGAIFSAMNTMYASVGARTREVGTLRVLGFRRRTILVSFLLEGAFLALVGGALGCILAMPMNGLATGTLSFDNFSEVVFEFRITPKLIAKGLLFSVTVGLVGSFLPAIRAARLPVIASLKAL